MESVGVPNKYRKFKEKWQIALELLKDIKISSNSTLTFDSGYGTNKKFLKKLDDRGYRYVSQIKGTETFSSASISVDRKSHHIGRPRKYPHPEDKMAKAKSAQQWADELFKETGKVKTYSSQTDIPQRNKIVSKRVFESIAHPPRVLGSERWLIIEETPKGERRFYISNFPISISPRRILLLGRQRWKIEQGYQQLKEELGMDPYEGRSWRGFHHHVTLCFMAFVLLSLNEKNTQKV